MAAEIRIPETVLEAYHAAEPRGLIRELGWCKKGGASVFVVKNATGYEDETVLFDVEGRMIGRVRVPDTGPTVGDFDLSQLSDCRVLRRRQI